VVDKNNSRAGFKRKGKQNALHRVKYGPLAGTKPVFAHPVGEGVKSELRDKYLFSNNNMFQRHIFDFHYYALRTVR
jgi:hypothetical protein